MGNCQSAHLFRSKAAELILPVVMLLCFAMSCNGDQTVADGVPDNADIVLEYVESDAENFRVIRILDNLENPWGFDWLPDGRMIITERPGRMNLVDNEQIIQLSGLPDIQAQDQGGLLDIAVHPDFENTGWIYFTYSAPGEEGTGTALARAQLNSDELSDVEVLYVQEPMYSTAQHYGSRIVLPGDGTVIFTIGDRAQGDPAQDLLDPAGSTIRINEDGTIPEDNPFINRDDVLPEIFSYGHRNAQGMAIHPETGAIWQNEHGPRGGDELNIIRAGANFGWPDATYGREYADGSPIGTEPHEDPDSEDPLIHWSPTSIAPSGMTFYTGENFPGWSGDIFLGALAQQHLLRVVTDGEEVTDQEELLRDEIGRIRDVRAGPDGNIYLLTDHSDGALYRVEPVDQ